MMLMRCGTSVERLVNLIFARLGGFLRPEAGDGGGGDRDAAFLFLLHPVGHGVAVIHVTDLVDQSGVKENTLGRRRLAGVNVRGDADVAGAFQRVFAVGRIRRRFIFTTAACILIIRLRHRVGQFNCGTTRANKWSVNYTREMSRGNKFFKTVSEMEGRFFLLLPLNNLQ